MLAILFGWLGISAFRKKRAAAAEANVPIAQTDLSAHSVFSTTSVAPPPSEQEPSQFSSAGLGMGANLETVDPVVEADTFLAFGRDAQAEEILLDALKTDPQRQAIHLKLLDIYAARKNASRFESVAKDLHKVTGGAGAGWEKAAAMGAALDPENPLYVPISHESTVVVPAAAFDMEATTILRSPLVEEQAPQAAAVAPATAEAAALDFDLDLGTASSEAVAAAPVAEADVGALDFDLDLGGPEAAVSAAAPQIEAKSEVAALDIDFDMPTKESAPPLLDFPLAEEKPAAVPAVPAAPVAPVVLAVVPTDPGSIDFDFDLGTPDSVPAVSVAPVAPAAPAAPSPEMSLELPASAATPEPMMTALDLGGISLELDTPPAVSSAGGSEPAAADMADNPEVATKIELAMAYEEMGDRDGARELFQEAAAEGSPAQQKVARAKLDSLG